MALPLLEEKEFTQPERMKFAEKLLPIFTHEEEQLKNPVKTSRFSDDENFEEYHISLQNGDTLGFIKSTDHVDFEANFRSQEKLVSTFRQMAMDPWIDQGKNQIVDEAMSFNFSPDSKPMKLMLNVKSLTKMGLFTDNIERKIYDCYEDVLGLLDFTERGWEYFNQWFTDGKIFFELVFDKGEKEIQEIKLISPFNILKVKHKEKFYYLYDETKEREVRRRHMLEDDTYLETSSIPIVNYKNYNSKKDEEIKLIPEKYVIAVESGIKPFGYPLSPLYFVRKLLNQLQLLQDAVVVYRISTAADRQVIYVDVGNIHNSKVEQVVKQIAKEFKQKLVYDHRTGNILDHRHVTATTESYVIPRYGNGQSTEVKTLPGGDQLGKIQDVQYFLEQTYRAMKIPLSRFGLGDSSIVNIGNDSSVERDEITFSKYIKRLRQQFNKLIWGLLQRQLLCKNVIAKPSEFKKMKLALSLHFEGENYYDDLQRLDTYQRKLTMYQQAEPLIENGKLSETQVCRDILGMSVEDIEKRDDERVEDLARNLAWVEANLVMLEKMATIEGNLELLRNPQLQLEFEQLKVQQDFTDENNNGEK